MKKMFFSEQTHVTNAVSFWTHDNVYNFKTYTYFLFTIGNPLLNKEKAKKKEYYKSSLNKVVLNW